MPGGMDLIGVTLPGEPFQVVGSNRHVAWAFTDSYIETGDAVVIETLPADPGSYKTPDGVRKITVARESICVAHGGCEDLAVPETIWGTVLGHDVAGHPVAWRWMAHDQNAVGMAGLVALEKATTVREALDAAHMAGLPDQNFTVGDKDGHIAWTVIGQVPRRTGLDDQLPHSWADNAHGWNGYLTAKEVPEIVDPPDGRIWTANARTLGGAGLATLGNGGYAGPERARAIHDDLFARERFAETDMLAIATETRNHLLDAWQERLLQAIAAKPGDARVAALRPLVQNWGGRALPDSAGYRLVREFRGAVIKRIYAGLGGKLGAQLGTRVPIAHNADRPCLRLLEAQPAALVPPSYKSWDDVLQAGIGDLFADIAQYGDGKAADYTWGLRNHVGIQHPLAMAIPGLGMLTDPPDVPEPGDDLVPRVSIPGFGASERMIVSPGHEERAIFEMPVGQSDNPLSPYYGAGQAAWVNGTVAPLLPGETRWHLRLIPAQ
jgi:penicillin amidase